MGELFLFFVAGFGVFDEGGEDFGEGDAGLLPEVVVERAGEGVYFVYPYVFCVGVVEEVDACRTAAAELFEDADCCVLYFLCDLVVKLCGYDELVVRLPELCAAVFQIFVFVREEVCVEA